MAAVETKAIMSDSVSRSGFNTLPINELPFIFLRCGMGCLAFLFGVSPYGCGLNHHALLDRLRFHASGLTREIDRP
jgi:hypothetical protein